MIFVSDKGICDLEMKEKVIRWFHCNHFLIEMQNGQVSKHVEAHEKELNH